jgi:hypothetical protein
MQLSPFPCHLVPLRSKTMHIKRLKLNFKQWAESTDKTLQIRLMTEHLVEHMCNIPVATWLQGFCQLNCDSDLKLSLSIPRGSIQLRRKVSRLGQVGVVVIQRQTGWATTRNLTWLASRWRVTILLLLYIHNLYHHVHWENGSPFRNLIPNLNVRNRCHDVK